MMPSVCLANASNACTPAFMAAGQHSSERQNHCRHAEGTPKVYASPQSVNAYPWIFPLFFCGSVLDNDRMGAEPQG